MPAHLQQLIERGQSISVSDLGLSANVLVTEEVQTHLCDIGLLDPIIDGDADTPFRPVRKADGKLGLNTRNALLAFHHYAQLPYVDNLLGPDFFTTLENTRPDAFFPVQFDTLPDDDPQTRLAKRVLRYMHKKGYWIARAPDTLNIVYVEGINADGQPNDDRLNEWNDRRMLIRILPGGRPEMLANDQATTEPGRFYTMNPLNRLGVARIAFGQYKAWVDGVHKGFQPALVQRGKLRLHRDLNRNSQRDASDPIDVGDSFGINQHSTAPDANPAFVDKFSAGCLVGRRYRWHLSFMQLVRQDIRYAMNKGYVFMSTVLDGADLAKEEPG
ncbi:MAG: peptidoglycan-binding protein [Lewinellaceae bacterium]|nr:peptidoglycan-binding protein [Lewinellaceae bacterium]